MHLQTMPITSRSLTDLWLPDKLVANISCGAKLHEALLQPFQGSFCAPYEPFSQVELNSDVSTNKFCANNFKLTAGGLLVSLQCDAKAAPLCRKGY